MAFLYLDQRKLHEMETVSPLGRHLIVDVWGEVDSMPYWDMDGCAVALKNAAVKVGATVMSERWHHFGAGHGYTGVVILAESHISVHTWPEKGYAAIDAFMCGKCDPREALDDILNFYKTKDSQVTYIVRGTKENS